MGEEIYKSYIVKKLISTYVKNSHNSTTPKNNNKKNPQLKQGSE